MDTAEYVRQQFSNVRRLTDAVAGDLTDACLNWAPPGTANSISATLLHTIGTEDMFIRQIFQAQPLVWEAGGYRQRTGIAAIPGQGVNWESVARQTLDMATLQEYATAVRAATDRYVNALGPEDMEREVDFMGGERSVGEILALLLMHTTHHIGEVAVLKGVQGFRGMPF